MKYLARTTEGEAGGQLLLQVGISRRGSLTRLLFSFYDQRIASFVFRDLKT